jgi:hypothetical protein
MWRRLPRVPNQEVVLFTHLLSFSLVVSASAAAESLPSSMEEFVNWNLDRGVCGQWQTSGVTKDMWAGVPSGLEYTHTMSSKFDVDTGRLVDHGQMQAEDGTIISTGSGVMTWDEERGTVVGTFSGFDMGKPFHGSSVLTSATDDTLTWEYTEMSRGETTTYVHSTKYTGRNTRENSFQVKGSSDAPWVTIDRRVKPTKAMLADAGLPGTWMSTNPDGSRSRTVVSWAAGEHVLKYERFEQAASGGEWTSSSLFVWYWDAHHDHIATMYLDDHGTVIHGSVESISKSGDTVTIISNHEGNRYHDLTMSTQAKQVVTPNSITNSWTGMSLNGKRHKLSWSEGSYTTQRAKK